MPQVLCGGNCSHERMRKGDAHWAARSRAGKRCTISADGISPGKHICDMTALYFTIQLATGRPQRVTDVPDLCLALYIALFVVGTLSSACLLITTNGLPLSHSAGSSTASCEPELFLTQPRKRCARRMALASQRDEAQLTINLILGVCWREVCSSGSIFIVVETSSLSQANIFFNDRLP